MVTYYAYRDESGTLLYQKVRLEPKAFRLRRPDGQGGWTYNLDGTRRVLLGLPELIDVTDIFIVEGEKDVRALQKLGLSATTNAGGAGQWRDDYAQQLSCTGALRVNIIPDNDEPGQTHAATVARSCHTAGIEARIVRLPDLRPKGDVSDYLDAGHTPCRSRGTGQGDGRPVTGRHRRARTCPAASGIRDLHPHQHR